MIENVIKNRLEISGLTQARLSELAECTPTQLGVFLQGKGFVNQRTLEKCLEVLGIDINIYQRRLDLAYKVSSSLKDEPIDSIKKMTKAEMANKSHENDVMCLLDIDEKRFDTVVESGIVDYESTFPYFKSLVLHLRVLNGKTTPKSVEDSFAELLGVKNPNAGIPLVGMIAMPFVGLSALIGIAVNKLFEQYHLHDFTKNAFAPLVAITKVIFRS